MTYFNILIIPACTDFFSWDLTEILERKTHFCAPFGLSTYGLEKIAKMLNVCSSEVTTPAVGQDRELSSPVHIPFCPHPFKQLGTTFTLPVPQETKAAMTAVPDLLQTRTIFHWVLWLQYSY